MAQYLGARVAVSGDSIGPSIHMVAYNQGTRYPLRTLWAPRTNVVHMHTCRKNTHSHKDKVNKSKKPTFKIA